MVKIDCDFEDGWNPLLTEENDQKDDYKGVNLSNLET
jgi:hypothetical protein